MFLQPTENNNTETAGGGLMVVINVEPYSRWPDILGRPLDLPMMGSPI